MHKNALQQDAHVLMNAFMPNLKCLPWKTLPQHERTRANTCVNKSLVMALESCPSSDVTPPAVLPTLMSSLVEIQSQLA